MKNLDFSIIRNLRMKRGMSAEELAKAANLTRATIAKIENGGGNPTMDTIEALAGTFQLLPSELVQMAEIARFEETRTEPVKNYEGFEGAIEGKHLIFSDFGMFHIHAEVGAKIKSDPKFHENTAEICFVLSGRVIVMIGEQSRELISGTALRFKALFDHQISIMEKSELLMIHYNLT
ncbi:helix-turn-helix domain-containing protein [Desulfoscipio gibsoniae]